MTEGYPDESPESIRAELLATVRSLRSLVVNSDTNAAAIRWNKPATIKGGQNIGKTAAITGAEVAESYPGKYGSSITANSRNLLDKACLAMTDCQLCPLGKTRRNLVFGDGNPNARLVFVGEAPGADEDAQGLPFVGRAGQLLTKIIEAMGLTREDVYICNILKCRPPQNRNPLPEEIAACEPFLKKQLQIIAPSYICALGSFAAKALLRTETPITALRGRFHSYEGIKLMPTYHPAYLLRNPAAKKFVWDDMQLIMNELGLKTVKSNNG